MCTNNICYLNISINTCHYMANCLYLHDSYSTKFDFVNYAFANLVVAWLYDHLSHTHESHVHLDAHSDVSSEALGLHSFIYIYFLCMRTSFS